MLHLEAVNYVVVVLVHIRWVLELLDVFTVAPLFLLGEVLLGVQPPLQPALLQQIDRVLRLALLACLRLREEAVAVRVG